MKRYRKDSPPKPGKGIDGTLGERYGKTNVVSPWSYGEGDDQSKYDPDTGIPLEDAATDYVFSGPQSRGILDQVEAQSRPRGDDNFGFDAPGPVREVEDKE